MLTRSRWPAVLGTGLALGLVLCRPVPAAAQGYAEAWKLATTSVWPPAVIDGKVILKNGDTLAAHGLTDGAEVWKKKLKSLRYGSGVLAAGAKRIFVLAGKGMYIVDPATGKVLDRRKMDSPSYVYHHGGSVYVVAKNGIFRINAATGKVISKTRGYTGEIRGADRDYVVLYSSETAAKRLIVVNLKSGKKTYEFKLLPRGWHRVVKVDAGRVVFIDYSRRGSDGANAKKLYFTEADYVRSKKVKDKALHKRFPETYSSAARDHFWTATDDSGIVFIGNHGAGEQSSSLMAYDPGHDKMLWSRSGAMIHMGLLLHRGKLWTGVTDSEGNSHAVAYSPDDGSLLFRLPLDAAGTGQPVAAGSRVLVRSRASVHCFAPASKAVSGGTAKPATTTGWRTYRDRTAGYLIQTPKTWHFQRSKLLKMGGLRMSIPFVRTDNVGGKKRFLGSVHVLTWEAAGRDVNTLWNSVYTQRRQLNPEVRVVKVNKVHNVGGTGLTAIKAVYTFRSKQGYPVQLRSLCVVSHGVAFELRGWAGAVQPAQIWREIEGIFRTFRPQKF